MAQQITLYFHEGRCRHLLPLPVSRYLFGESLEEEISGLSRCVLHVKGELAGNNYTDSWCEIVAKLPALHLRVVSTSSGSLGALPLGRGSQLR